jgi:predicted nucleic-acid-binding protein
MTELLVDANLVLRYLTGDDPAQSPAATALFEQAENGEVSLCLDILPLAECVYVLTGQYRHSRTDAVLALLDLLKNPGLTISDQPTVRDALLRFESSKVDFQDAWLAARAAKSGQAVASFDRDFDKFKDVQRFEPRSSNDPRKR